ncbi:hypothetical protein [uncultured Stenotrophomonas sp.]|uniref:hypothetical protein n=1 Tax=uncultured Stenotrophomonas sp. TaxID=165438 RepID=UPI0025F895C2|nr:hypothetical protein [uncultured Stenotrophomonas sp.]
MKRRKFIHAALISPALVPLSGRLYGEPGSVLPVSNEWSGERLLLPLSRTGLPPESWNHFAAASQVVENVIKSPTEAEIFFKNPRDYFIAYGFDPSDKLLMGESAKILTCLSDPIVRSLIDNRQWESAFRYFRTCGLFDQSGESSLSVRIDAIVRDNSEQIRQLLRENGLRDIDSQQRALLQILEESGAAPTEDDLAIVTQMVAGGENTTFMCSAVTICAAAVTAAVFVTAVVYLMVAVISAAAVLTEVSTAGESGTVSKMASAPFNGSLLKLDSTALKNMQRAVTIGVLANSDELQLHVYRDAIGQEVDAVMRAMSKEKLISLNEIQLSAAIKAVTAYSVRVAGLQTHQKP